MQGKADIEVFRVNKDKFFRSSHHSPLTETQKERFKGLEYFPYNPDLVFDLEMNVIENPEVVTMQTSDNRIRDYYRYGYLEFEVEGEKARLYVYKGIEDGDYYFIPFKDATSGKETYGAGRYVEIEKNRDGTFHLDFNMAYNPYCAYNGNYSCPIPPEENILEVPIRAGEMTYPDPEY